MVTQYFTARSDKLQSQDLASANQASSTSRNNPSIRSSAKKVVQSTTAQDAPRSTLLTGDNDIDRVLSELPLLSTNRTGIFRRRLTEPLADALQVEGVPALSPHHGTVLAGVFHTGAHAFKGRLTNAADIVIGVPTPGGHRVKRFTRTLT